MDSLVNAVRSLPITTPVPAVPPPLRATLTGEVKPSAEKAADEVVILRFCAVPVCSVIAPLAEMVGATPVIAPILLSSVPTVSPTLMLLPAVGVLTMVRVVPSTVIVSPTAKLVVKESLGAVPDKVVAAVIGAG